MCTAATYKTADFYFGRTLDYEFSYGDEVTVTPRNYPLTFRHASAVSTHYAIIGMAHVAGDYPLYYDAFNEKGLCMAGLNFVGNASYQKPQEDHDNIAQFEFIPWILSVRERGSRPPRPDGTDRHSIQRAVCPGAASLDSCR